MKILPISDIHSEIWLPKQGYWTVQFKKWFDQVDVLVIAGDNSSCINNLVLITQVLLEFPKLEIVYVLGNHDYYMTRYNHAWESMLWADYSIDRLHVLTGYDKCAWEFQDVVFIGGTLWTDFNQMNSNAINAVQRGLNDYRAIASNNGTKPITANFIYNEHCTMKKNIFRLLERYPDKKRVVVTHHKPFLSEIITDPLTYGYEVDLTKELNECTNLPEYWIYGHTHKSGWTTKSYINGDVTFISNQFGYPSEDTSVTGFHKDCILEV